MDAHSNSRRALKSAQEHEDQHGAETKGTELDVVQKQWNKGAKD